MELKLEITKKGLPAYWESGGGYTNTGWSKVVAGPEGKPLSPVFESAGGHLACGEHGLFVVREGDHIAFADRTKQEVKVFRIASLFKDGVDWIANCDEVGWRKGEEEELPECLRKMVSVAWFKATCYHCREVHYRIPKQG